MKKIKTSDISVGVGYPLSKKGFDFLQASYQEVLARLAQTIVGNTEVLSTPYILYGCKKTSLGGSNYSFTAGAFYFNGEVFLMDEVVTIALATAPVCTITTTNDATADPATFTDGSVKNVHNIRKIVISNGALGSADYNYDDAQLLNQGWIAKDSYSGYKRSGNTVSLYGRCGASGSPMGSSGSSFTLPVGYRPLSTQIIKGVLLFDTGADATAGNLTVNTDGTVWHGSLTGAGVARWTSITGVSFSID